MLTVITILGFVTVAGIVWWVLATRARNKSIAQYQERKQERQAYRAPSSNWYRKEVSYTRPSAEPSVAYKAPRHEPEPCYHHHRHDDDNSTLDTFAAGLALGSLLSDSGASSGSSSDSDSFSGGGGDFGGGGASGSWDDSSSSSSDFGSSSDSGSSSGGDW